MHSNKTVRGRRVVPHPPDSFTPDDIPYEPGEGFSDVELPIGQYPLTVTKAFGIVFRDSRAITLWVVSDDDVTGQFDFWTLGDGDHGLRSLVILEQLEALLGHPCPDTGELGERLVGLRFLATVGRGSNGNPRAPALIAAGRIAKAAHAHR